MYAVIKTGGKQYRVASGDILKTEKLDAEAGSTVEFGHVLMVGGEKVQIGTPTVQGACVTAEVVEQRRGNKIVIFKKKRRKHFRRCNGHRQFETVVRITEVLADGKRKVQKKAAVDAV